MNYLKAFIAGLVLPATITPIVILIAVLLGKDQILSVASLHALPLIWGVWNILYFEWFRSLLPGYMDLRLLINGAALGLLLALYGVFFLHLPALMGFEEFRFYPLLLAPIVYAVLWRFGVKPLNDLIGLYEK